MCQVLKGKERRARAAAKRGQKEDEEAEENDVQEKDVKDAFDDIEAVREELAVVGLHDDVPQDFKVTARTPDKKAADKLKAYSSGGDAIAGTQLDDDDEGVEMAATAGNKGWA